MSSRKMQTNSIKITITDEFSLDKYIFPLVAGDRIFFYGDLGAGKSTFIRHLLRKHLNNPELVVRSPTYTYYQKYEGGSMKEEVGRRKKAGDTISEMSFQVPSSIYHFDLYRIEDIPTFYSIGGMEILENPDTIALIEWPELIEDFIEPTKKVSIQILENGERELTIQNLS